MKTLFYFFTVMALAAGCQSENSAFQAGHTSDSSYGDTYADADTDADVNTYTYTYTYTDTDINADTNIDADTNIEKDIDVDIDIDLKINIDVNIDVNIDMGADTDADTGGDADSDADAGNDLDTDRDTSPHTNADSETNADTSTGTASTSNNDNDISTHSDSDSLPPVAGIAKDAEGLITYSGLTIVSYGGYLNGESFQQEGIVSYNGYQYTAFWNTNRNVVMARRALPDGEWAKFDFTDYTNTEDDAHNTISLGICPGDGTLHLAFDHHGSTLHYRKSVANLVTDPASANWSAASFSEVTGGLVGGETIILVTYPRFVTEPGGGKMLLAARIGSSGSGDEALWEYDATTQAWTAIGKFIDGISNDVNAYIHGLAYTRGGSRLHVAWCWRETPNATTNHDLFYMYSDDNGRTWKDDSGGTVAVSGSSFATMNSDSARVWTIGQNRGLINQEHMAVDADGRVHVLLSHMPDIQAADSDFTSARTKSEFFHYWRDTDGNWSREALGLPVIENFRGKLAVAASGNVYAILPGMRIAGASLSLGFGDWTLLDNDTSRSYFSDPLIDTARLETVDALTIYYPEASSPNIWGLEYTVR